LNVNVSRVSPFVAALSFAIVVLGSGEPAGGQGAAPPTLTILSRDGRRALPLNIVNDQELVFLDDLSSAFQVTVREESLGAFTVAYKNKTILLTPDQPLVSIAGRLVSLPAAPTRSGRRWLVPVEFINRALALIYDSPLDLRKTSRLLIVGDLRVPRLSVLYQGGDPARLIVDATPRTTSTVSQENNSLSIKFDADALDVALPLLQPQPLVQAIRLVEPATLAVDLGPRFGAFRAVAQPLDSATRLTIDMMSAQTDQQPATAAQTVQAPDLSPFGQPVSAIRTIAIDPGHGGEDEGVKGSGGTREKDLTLAVARPSRAALAFASSSRGTRTATCHSTAAQRWRTTTRPTCSSVCTPTPRSGRTPPAPRFCTPRSTRKPSRRRTHRLVPSGCRPSAEAFATLISCCGISRRPAMSTDRASSRPSCRNSSTIAFRCLSTRSIVRR
jgi:N-acetylmuramoyl-L-alanine amidase